MTCKRSSARDRSSASRHLAGRRRQRGGRLCHRPRKDAQRGLRAVEEQEVPAAADPVHAAVAPAVEHLLQRRRELAAGRAVDVVEDRQAVQEARQAARVAPVVERPRHPQRQEVHRLAAELRGLAPVLHAGGVPAEVPGRGDVLEEVQRRDGAGRLAHPAGRDAIGGRVAGDEAALQRDEAPEMRGPQVPGQHQAHGAAEGVAHNQHPLGALQL
mmetsp:Transcript_104997/g.306777  ORF Transcript_104997/g.306777 Transcript_104997/m.306777 type:complete len:214 (+) Transcript_104997:170-811(+)